MRVTALTGAGISTDSGIPDYRGPQGLWRVDPEYQKLVTYDYYVNDPDIRRRSWLARAANPAWTAQPNPAHQALAALADGWIVTQNVDGLHRAAGSPSARVLELHGNMFDALCIECDARSTTREAVERLQNGEDDPRCIACGGILKTATIMFGQPLDGTVLNAAVDAVRSSDLLIAIGTSLLVHPAAGLVDVATDDGVPVIIVNAEPTPYDHLAERVIREPISQAVPALVRELPS